LIPVSQAKTFSGVALISIECFRVMMSYLLLSGLLTGLLAEGEWRVSVADQQKGVGSYSQTPAHHPNDEAE
jgi:hypothetical protein